MDVNRELDEGTADRLLAGALGPGQVEARHRRLVTLLAAARAEPSAAELARQAHTVREMVAARRGAGEETRPSPASWASPFTRRRNLRLGAVAVATSLSFSTGLAAARLLPDPLRSVASGALPSLAVSPQEAERHEPAGRSPEGPDEEPGPPRADGGRGTSPPPSSPPGAQAPDTRASGARQAPNTPAGQAGQAGRAVLRAEAETSGGRLVVTFQEAGVGADAVTVAARADATATYGCFRRGGRNEKPRREGRVAGVSRAGSRFAAVDGRAGGTLVLTAPPPAGLSCPAGEAPQLVRVTYQSVVVVDSTTGASTTLNRTFSASA